MFDPSETQYYNGSGETTSHTFTLASLDDEDFAAWAALSRDGQKYNGGDELTITETTSVYAVWKDKIKNYDVTYDYRTNGGTGTTAANGEVMQGAKADLSGTAEKDGYVFVGWNTDQNAHEALDEYIVEKDTVLYAIFAKEITVTYNEVSPGLSIANTGKLYNNDEYVTIEAPALAARLGWTALGWREVNGNASVIFANGAVTTDKDITVEAVYTRNITLTYDLNGASSYVEPQTKLQTSYQTEIPFILAYPPRRADYSFAGWEINGKTIEYKYNEQNTVMLTDSATAKAVWQDNRPTVEQVTVTYDYRTNGGSSISASDTRLLTKGANVDLTLTAYRDGYGFIGWNTDRDAHDALESVKADSNITLYAIYKKDVTATFCSGEYVSAENTVTVSESIWNNDRTAEVTFPQAAGYDGWSFKGWRDDRHPLEPVYTGSTVRISADKSFFAIYQREISITGDVDDQSRTQYSNTGSGTFAVAVSVGYSVTEEPEREGMRCVGYEVYEDGEKVSDCYEGETIMVSDSVSVVAKWVPIPDGATLPDVETVGASVSSYTSADLTLDVQNDDIAGNEIISQGFVYWSKNDVNSKYTVRTSDMTAALSNLSQGTEYYYYAFAENAAGIGKGTIKTFKTDSDKTPNAIMISPEYVSLEKGGVYQLLATLLPETAANREIFWSSSNESVVKVDPDGKLTGVSAGQAIITATTEVGRLTAECIVDVAERQEAVEYDFSEWHLASHMGTFGAQGYDWDAATGGGNYQMSTAYLARWDGAVLESKDKYPGFAGSAASLVHNGIGADFHVQNVEWIPKRTGDLDNDDIKSALMEYGAVYTVMNADWSCFTADNVSFYCPYTTDVNSHAITIVGWDDSYSRRNFKTTAPGDGAFICKNSWGSDWAQGGYFYISYYDKNLGRKDSNAAFTGVEGTDNYNKIYQYDPLGAVGYIGFPETTYAANVFPPSGETVTNDETLKAVSFYTYQKNTTYDVYIVTDYQDQYSLEELRAPDATGTIKNSGYHTIELKTPVAIEKGTRFAVVVKYDTPGQDAYVYCEYPVGGYSSKARANADESYIGFDPYDWNDLTDWVDNANFCIKAFTDNGLAGTSSLLFSGVDNENREYENDKIYTLDEAVENGFGVSDEYSDFADDAAETAQLSDAPSMSLGNVPSIARTGLNTVSFTDGAMFPSSYDLREMGVVSSVKDQGQWGTCWAHATYASLESGILKKAKTTQTDEKATEATDITLSRGEATLGSDAAITVAKKIMPLNLEDKSVTWISSDESVVTVDTNGTIRAVGDGVASIAVSTTSGGRVAQCSVVVDTGNIEKTVTLEAETLVKEIGDKFMVAYSVTPITAEDDAMTWISDNTNVAAVNENGVIEIVGEGSADVSIVSDGEIMDTVTIVSGDGFNLEPTAIDASGASLTDGVLAGAVSVNVMNNASSAKSATVALGIYGGDGRLAGTRYATQVLEPGVSTITIDDISIEGISGSYTYKCMLWNAVGDMAPMSIAISENAAESAEE